MAETKKQPIPNPQGPQLKVGDKVKITEGELIGMVGEVVEFFDRGKNWVKKIKVVREDGKVEFIEVTSLAIEAVMIIEDLTKTSIFKKFAKWVVNLFRKKKNKPKPPTTDK